MALHLRPLVLAAALASACGGRSAAPDAGPMVNDLAQPPADLAQPAADSMLGPEPFTRIGSVTIMQPSNGGAPALSAAFFELPAGDCFTRTIGPCKLSACAVPDMSGARPLNAGLIVVGSGASSVALSFDPQTQTYSAPPRLPMQWPYDSVIPVKGMGADVFSFDAQVTLPHVLDAILTPDVTTIKTIPRTSDFAVGWKGGDTNQRVLVELMAGHIGGSLTALQCFYPSGYGGISAVPTAALATLPVGQYQLRIWAVDQATVPTLGGFIHVNAASSLPYAAPMVDIE